MTAWWTPSSGWAGRPRQACLLALVNALIAAGQQGAQIDLIVRGACILPAQVPGLTDRIRVRSVIGRMLEHTRVLWFQVGPVT